MSLLALFKWKYNIIKYLHCQKIYNWNFEFAILQCTVPRKGDDSVMYNGMARDSDTDRNDPVVNHGKAHNSDAYHGIFAGFWYSVSEEVRDFI